VAILEETAGHVHADEPGHAGHKDAGRNVHVGLEFIGRRQESTNKNAGSLGGKS
jgi:hypothetical protein